MRGITALFGPSGSGKTTLLRAIAGLEKCENGFLQLGTEIWQSKKFFLSPHRRGSGLIFQEVDLFPHLSVFGNLQYGYKRLSHLQRKFSLDQIISLLNINHLLERGVIHLSGGERQLVALGRTLLYSPRLLLLDEPLAALDQHIKLSLFPHLRNIATQLAVPILYVSHSIDEVARLADSLILINAGKIVASGEINEMLTAIDLPLSKNPEAEVLIRGTVAGHDEVWHLTRILFSGGEFRTPHIEAPIGSAVRLRVAASDVSLSLSHPVDSSILNVFPATVQNVVAEQGPLVLIKLDLAGTSLLACITQISCNRLEIRKSSQVFAQIKSAAILM